jgi:hypothetical protein
MSTTSRITVTIAFMAVNDSRGFLGDALWGTAFA